MNRKEIEPNNYQAFLDFLIRKIDEARYQAYKVVNSEQISLYWEIGKSIIQKQIEFGWGKSVVEKLSIDLRDKTGDKVSFSARNLWFMRQMYDEYSQIDKKFTDSKNSGNLKQLVSEIQNLKQIVSLVPWGQNILILQKTKDIFERIYYLRATAGNGWSRSVLINQIKAGAYQTWLENPKKHNFNRALPSHLAEQADEALKSRYNLEFLGITQPVLERRLENLLVENVKKLIMELGYGFCFIGNQFKLMLGSKEYFVDLLFYHRVLQCIVAIELKTTEFRPEYTGEMEFYLTLLDEQVKLAHENPSIGIILCAEKDNLEVEYALRIAGKPIGVAEYQLTRHLPVKFKGQLPSPRDFSQKAKRLFSDENEIS